MTTETLQAFRFDGGPRHGEVTTLDVPRNHCTIFIDGDRYTVRRHDRILLLSNLPRPETLPELLWALLVDQRREVTLHARFPAESPEELGMKLQCALSDEIARGRVVTADYRFQPPAAQIAAGDVPTGDAEEEDDD